MHSNRKITFNNTMFGKIIQLNHAFPEPEFYGENPIAKRFGMGFSQATVHALDRACTVAETWKAQPVCQESPPEK